MKSKIVKKLLAGFLAVVLMFQMGGSTTVFALEELAKQTIETQSIDVKAFNSKDVTGLLKNVSFTVSQDGVILGENDKLKSKEPLVVAVSFDVPVDGDVGADISAINAGDTATFNLAAGLSVGDVTDSPIIFSGQEVGKLTITYDANVTVTINGKDVKGTSVAVVKFSDLVDNPDYSAVKVKFEAEMNYNGTGAAGEEGDHVIQILNKDFTVSVPEKVTTITVTKTGVADVAQKVVNWAVKVEAKLDDGNVGSLKDCVFNDDLTKVGDFLGGSLKIGDSEDINTATAASPATTAPLTYNFLETDSGVKYIFFQTAIPDDLLSQNGEQTIDNTAKVTTSRPNVVTVDGEGKAKFEMKWIEKSGATVVGKDASGNYDPDNQKIQWSIIANHNGFSLTNAIITDKLNDDFTFESATLQKWDSSILPSGGWAAAQTTWDTAPLNGEYTLGDIDTKVLLTITTKWNNGSTPTGVQNYKNTATIKWDENTAGYGVTSANVGIGFAPISKKATGYTPADHEIGWNVNVDAQSQNYGTGALRALDLLVYAGSGFNVNDTYTIENNLSGDLFSVTNEDIKKLTPSYNQKYVAGSFVDTTPGKLNIVVHTLKKEGVPVADLLVVTSTDGTAGIDNKTANSFTFKTKVTNPAVYASNEVDYKVQNTVSMFSANARISNGSATQKCTSTMLFKDMLTWQNGADFEANIADLSKLNTTAAAKDKAFNYVNKGIYYRIHINANNLPDATKDITAVEGVPLGDLIVSDTLPKGWAFEKIAGKDFLLFEGAPKTAGLVDATQIVPENEYLNIFTGGTPVAPSGEVGGKISFTFTSLTKPYIILVKAVPTTETAAEHFSKNQKVTTKNNAALLAGQVALASEGEEATIESKLVTKTLDATKADKGGYLTWTVEYKPYALVHTEAHLEDIIPEGIDLPVNSKGEIVITQNIIITEMTLKPDGSYDVGTVMPIEDVKNAISYNSKTRALSFKIPDTTKAYKMTYITDITGDMGSKVENKVSLLGEETPQEGTQDKKNYSITKASSSASFSRSGWLLVTKQDDTGAPLAGAKFTVFAQDEKTVIREGVTAADGIVYLRVLPEGEYILKETQAPEGYVLDAQKHLVKISKDVTGAFITSIDRREGVKSNQITLINHEEGTVGRLKIEKRVGGNAGDLSKPFQFTLTLSDTINTYAYIGNGVPDGVIKSGDTINLAHNQSITIMNIPQEISYTVNEKDYSAEGYTVSKTGSSDVIIADETKTATFTNTKNTSDKPQHPNPQTGVR